MDKVKIINGLRVTCLLVQLFLGNALGVASSVLAISRCAGAGYIVAPFSTGLRHDGPVKCVGMHLMKRSLSIDSIGDLFNRPGVADHAVVTLEVFKGLLQSQTFNGSRVKIEEDSKIVFVFVIGSGRSVVVSPLERLRSWKGSRARQRHLHDERARAALAVARRLWGVTSPFSLQ